MKANQKAQHIEIRFQLKGLAAQAYRSLKDPKINGKPATPSQVAEHVLKQWLKQSIQL